MRLAHGSRHFVFVLILRHLARLRQAQLLFLLDRSHENLVDLLVLHPQLALDLKGLLEPGIVADFTPV